MGKRRPSGDGMVRKRSDGHWEGRIMVGHKGNGDLGAIPDGISDKKKWIVAYMRQHPEITNKSQIAIAVGVDRATVRRYYYTILEEQKL